VAHLEHGHGNGRAAFLLHRPVVRVRYPLSAFIGVSDLGFGILDLGLRVWGSGFGVWGLGFGAEGFGV
jgi:hypothetical protein